MESPAGRASYAFTGVPQGLFGSLFLGIVGIVAIFFLFTREITRFVQFIVLAVAIAVIFYTPGGLCKTRLLSRIFAGQGLEEGEFCITLLASCTRLPPA